MNKDEDLVGLELERAARARAVQGHAAPAFERLLKLAETRDNGQISRVARFIAATYNGEVFAFDPFDLRAVDVAISDDMLVCLDALRWAKASCTSSCLRANRACSRCSSTGS